METTENNKFSWIKNSVGLKIGIIGFIVLLMLIPSKMIKDLMAERNARHLEANHEVNEKWGMQQLIGGPVITVPCIEHVSSGNDMEIQTKYINILPDELIINGNINPVHLNRGIFDLLVYNADLKVSGHFDSIHIPLSSIYLQNILWDKAFISIGITDAKGINKNIPIKWNGENKETMPGTDECPIFSKGVHVPIKLDPNKKNTFSFNLDINGSGNLNMLPFGKQTDVHFQSDWPHPQFNGTYIPKIRNVTDTGFVADWTILQHNRNYPQTWTGNMSVESSAFGLALIEEVDIYQKSMRAVKYSMLFIILTFLVFLFSELIIYKKAHPIQYIMVGAALSIFFSLLIALSEHMHFNLSYAIASVIIISMITFFSKSVFESNRISLIVCLVLALLFAFLFVILQLADFSLILGNIGLVIALAVIMFVSRKIDWYNEKYKKNEEPV